MAGIEIRKTETEVGETGAGGNRTDTHYVLGGEIDGVFVPFVTKAAGYIDALVQQGKQNERQKSEAAGWTEPETKPKRQA
jgi:hypothetical protein